MSSQIRIVAYFSNVVLLASFLGIGLGVALGRRRSNFVQYCLPAVAVLSLVLAYSFTGLILSLLLKRSQDTPAALGRIFSAVFGIFFDGARMKAPALPAIDSTWRPISSPVVSALWVPCDV
jgi:ABC-type molybdate transport system permease subunit